MKSIQIGNAELDSATTRGWLLGDFVDEESLLHSAAVELKWGTHTAGETRDEWTPGDHDRSIAILISGEFLLTFPDTEIVLKKPGDYVVWAKGVSHKWKSQQDSILLTIRWRLSG